MLIGLGWVLLGYGTVIAVLLGCGRKSVKTSGPPAVAPSVAQTSAACRQCHEAIFAAWSPTDHALANRPVRPGGDTVVLTSFAALAGTDASSRPDFILGHAPMWQPLLTAAGGRWQLHELAYDPGRREWFNVFGAEGRRPGEWGHWTGRGMNWNSMCAQCHMTGYQKNYSATTDAYRSRWVEQGVSCIACHGVIGPGHGGGSKSAKLKAPAPFPGDRQKMMQTCATCHARNEQLTLDFQPGDNYPDFAHWGA